MNTLIYYSFSFLILSALILLIGLIKPKWILFWMEQPERLSILFIASALFMAGMVMFGEGNKRLQQEKITASQHIATPDSETPIPAPGTDHAVAPAATATPVTPPAPPAVPANPATPATP